MEEEQFWSVKDQGTAALKVAEDEKRKRKKQFEM